MSDFDPDAYLAQPQAAAPAQPFDPDKYLSDHEGGKSYDMVDGIAVPTGSKAAHDAQSAVSGRSNLDLALSGAGKSVVDLGRGIKQIAGVAGAQQEIDDAAARDQALMQTGAGLGGYLGGTLATSVLPAGIVAKGAEAAGLAKTATAATLLANPSTYLGGAVSGAAQGALQPTQTGDSRWGNAALGALGGAAGQGLARAGTTVAKAAAPYADALLKPAQESVSKAVKALTDAGVPLDAAQRTGSVLWNRAKIMLADNPLTAAQQATFADMQQKGINKAFLATMGETGNMATPDVMGRAMARLGSNYDAVASRVNMPYDHLEEPLSDILNNAQLKLNPAQFGVIQKNADDILNKAAKNGGTINGEQFSNIKKTLDGVSRSSDRDVAEVARDMRQALNDGLLKSASEAGNTADVALLRQTNQQWRNMRTLEGAIDKDGNGDISPARLANIMGQKANRSVSIYGKGDTSLSDLAQAANELLPNRTPNSGTVTRLASQAALPAALGAYGGMKEGDWKGVAGGVAAGVLLPKAAQKLLQAQGSKGAIDSLGNLLRPSALRTLPGGALQHLPDSVLESQQQSAKHSE